MLREAMLQLSKSDQVRSVIQRAPVTRSVVKRFIAGSTTDDAVRATSDIVHSGRLVTLDNLGEDTLDVHQARATRDEYVRLLAALEDALENFAGCAVVISHDRFFLDRLATHILAFEGNSHVEWFEGNFEAYEEDKIRRLGDEATRPHATTYKKLTR